MQQSWRLNEIQDKIAFEVKKIIPGPSSATPSTNVFSFHFMLNKQQFAFILSSLV